MRILLVNDDGIQAKGIQVLANILSSKHKIYIVAPANEQSGKSHALTINMPLKVNPIKMSSPKITAYSVEGTPADCTKLAIEYLLDKQPDLIISGINNGFNLGTDVLYSGTVGAALEGYIHKIPAIAVSTSSKSTISLEEIATIIDDKLDILYHSDNLFMYNINFPCKFHDNQAKFVFTKHGYRTYENEFEPISLPDGSTAYRMQGRAKNIGNDETTDIHVVDKGFISITPLQIERTDFNKLTQIKNFGGTLNGIND